VDPVLLTPCCVLNGMDRDICFYDNHEILKPECCTFSKEYSEGGCRTQHLGLSMMFDGCACIYGVAFAPDVMVGNDIGVLAAWDEGAQQYYSQGTIRNFNGTFAYNFRFTLKPSQK